MMIPSLRIGMAQKSKGNGLLTSATTALVIQGLLCLPLGLDACIKNRHYIDTSWVGELLWQGASHVNLTAQLFVPLMQASNGNAIAINNVD